MLDANIPDIAAERDKTVKKVKNEHDIAFPLIFKSMVDLIFYALVSW